MSHTLPGHDRYLDPPDDADDAAIDARADAISADREKVGELLFDDLSPASDDGMRDMEVRELAIIAAYATEAWTIIEQLDNGYPLTPWQWEILPKFYRAIRPLIADEKTLIRECAETEVTYERNAG